MTTRLHISEAQTTFMKECFDDVQSLLKTSCRLVYPPKFISCLNCIVNLNTKKSTNQYKAGGPYLFPANTLCPLCNGEGGFAEELGENVNLICNPSTQKYRDVGGQTVRVPAGALEVEGYLQDMFKLQRCSYLIPFIDMDTSGLNRYKLFGAPTPFGNLVKGRYFEATLERI